ncbi:hypothetical protein C8Q80DRAFT_544756 [Daedaleopsis nitida]|nr:hypothetical protein C8Q80DRAFT_544756 [Daedaleopsis nitida]
MRHGMRCGRLAAVSITRSRPLRLGSARQKYITDDFTAVVPSDLTTGDCNHRATLVSSLKFTDVYSSTLRLLLQSLHVVYERGTISSAPRKCGYGWRWRHRPTSNSQRASPQTSRADQQHANTSGSYLVEDISLVQRNNELGSSLLPETGVNASHHPLRRRRRRRTWTWVTMWIPRRSSVRSAGPAIQHGMLAHEYTTSACVSRAVGMIPSDLKLRVYP